MDNTCSGSNSDYIKNTLINYDNESKSKSN